MEFFVNPESDDEPEFTNAAILSTDLKRQAGFGKGGEKNYPGILTGLQIRRMEETLSISDTLQKRRS